MVKGGIDKNIFYSFLRCNKLALFEHKFKNFKEDALDYASLEENRIMFKELAYQITCKAENGFSKRVIKDKQFTTREGEIVTAHIILNRLANIKLNLPKENILIETVCTANFKDTTELNWLAYKLYLIKKTNYQIDKIWVVKVDGKYVRKGEITEDILFVEDVTTKINRYLPTIPSLIVKIRKYLQNWELPEKRKDVYCLEPSPCPFKKHCWSDMPAEHSVFGIEGLLSKTKFNLYWKDIYKLEEIPARYLNKHQSIQVKSELRGVPKHKPEKISNWLNEIDKEDNACFLSLDAAHPVMPLCDEAKPFESVPFIFSAIYQGQGDINYTPYQFISTNPSAPDSTLVLLSNLIQTLNIDPKATIVVYGLDKTKKCLNNLAKWFPAYKNSIDSLISRLVCMQEIFKECWYYHPQFKGSVELCKIAPIIIPDISYDCMSIKGKAHAANEFIMALNKKSTIKSETQKNLAEFCRLNAFAMMRIVRFLRTKRL